MRMPPPTSVSAAINSPTITMSAMAPSNITRGSDVYTVPPTTTSTASSRQSILMPRQQQSSLLSPPLNHSTGMNQSSPIFNSSSILKRLKAKAQSEMSSVLRLDPAVLLNRSSQVVSQEPAKQSRKGFHVCYYCQRIFSSPSLYANHINRPVARVLYRCHLCPSTSDAVVPVLQRTSSTEQSGNLSAPNLCALYAHMAQYHPLETPSAWKLIPSRLSVTALPWLTGNLEDGLKQQLSQSAFPQTIYSEGQELVDVNNDIDRRLTNMLRVSEFRFQPPDSGDGDDTFLLSPDVRFTSVFADHFISTPFNASESGGLSNDGLPMSLNSPISHLLFRLAEASSWHGHFFLAGWYPSIDYSCTQEATPSPPSTASFDEIQKAYEALLKDSQHHFNLSSTMENGTLRCMLCGTFRTDSCNSLRNHLTGCSNMADMATAKCALCSLPLVHNRRDALLCSIKAHLLFHLDIYLFCPHCGFAPPPDLPPPLAEVCLRLHLRFVCFHFNLVKVLLCSKPAAACREGIFLSVESFVQHWFEAHTPRKYACQLCGTPQTKLEEGVNSSANRLNYTLQFPDMATASAHIQERHLLPSASASAFSKVTYECSECPFMSSVPVEFVDHFSVSCIEFIAYKCIMIYIQSEHYG
ncbi:unnamed protein product [Rodentolepis nana]|uniref:C2H2-type domain-containing protein n=1 Tax=Rodentolepis nana TaxID=102285 RepID=A0A0R3T6B2_RODNA|nr:unnamed protein product [Rodentolepis nana]